MPKGKGGATFAEEYPHITSVGRGFLRILAGIGASLLTAFLVHLLGGSAFFAGWLAACTYLLASQQWKPFQ
jgi:hypothetical protein